MTFKPCSIIITIFYKAVRTVKRLSLQASALFPVHDNVILAAVNTGCASSPRQILGGDSSCSALLEITFPAQISWLLQPRGNCLGWSGGAVSRPRSPELKQNYIPQIAFLLLPSSDRRPACSAPN